MKYRQFIREGKRSSTFSSAGDGGMMGASKRKKQRLLGIKDRRTKNQGVPNDKYNTQQVYDREQDKNVWRRIKAPLNTEEKVNEQHGVYLKGGSIGTKHDHSQPVKVHDSKEDADAHAKRMNKLLSPGEKTYYKMRYHVKPVSEDVTEEINEEYHVFSGQTVHSKHGSREDALTHAKPGTEVGKLAKKFKGQRYDEFQGYSHVWDHQGKKRPLED